MNRSILLTVLLCVHFPAWAQTVNLAATWHSDSTNAGGYANCTLTLTNIGSTTLTNKVYEMDYARQLSGGGVMTLALQSGNHYTFTNVSYYKGPALQVAFARIGYQGGINDFLLLPIYQVR